jgi:hypothetical protein
VASALARHPAGERGRRRDLGLGRSGADAAQQDLTHGGLCL